MRILELIQRTTDFFAQRGMEQPRLQIELLLAHVLREKRLHLYLQFERELEEKTLVELRDLVRRRAAGEPLQYLVGSVNFHGLELAVDPRALIPRPETEILVETVLGKIKKDAGGVPPGEMKILDLGTGSGCIALALASELPEASVWATDISPEALALARENATRCGFAGRVEFLQGDLFAGLSPDRKFHALVSNPPYIAEGDRATLSTEVRDHEPAGALYAGPTGLELIEKIIADAPRFLHTTGILALEVGLGQATKVREQMNASGWKSIEIVKDLSGIDRIVLATQS